MDAPVHDQEPLPLAARHAFFWLMAGNAVGLWLSILLLFPSLNALFGEFTYGRIVPLHLNFQLYGWSSLPLVAWLLQIYRCSAHASSRAAIVIWSAALVIGGVSWLLGGSSGKIFLEWSGFARAFFTLAMTFLWCVLAASFAKENDGGRIARAAKGAGLVALLTAPGVWHFAGSERVYPPVNPSTSGPTAASLLGSTLSVIFLLLLAGPALGHPNGRRTAARFGWIAFAASAALFVLADKSNASHRGWREIATLGSLLVWAPLLPAYFRAFDFSSNARRWMPVFLLWFAALTLTGWFSFLPGVLDRWKFTNALVAHSHLAMAGFVTAFNMFLLHALLARQNMSLRISGRSFLIWNLATIAHVTVLWTAGTLEAADSSFTILPTPAHTVLYGARALFGAVMFGVSLHWWRASLHLQHAPAAHKPCGHAAAEPALA